MSRKSWVRSPPGASPTSPPIATHTLSSHLTYGLLTPPPLYLIHHLPPCITPSCISAFPTPTLQASASMPPHSDASSPAYLPPYLPACLLTLLPACLLTRPPIPPPTCLSICRVESLVSSPFSNTPHHAHSLTLVTSRLLDTLQNTPQLQLQAPNHLDITVPGHATQ